MTNSQIIARLAHLIESGISPSELAQEARRLSGRENVAALVEQADRYHQRQFEVAA